MRNKFKEIDIKIAYTIFFLDYMINTENLDPNKIKINEKSNKNIVIYQIGYVSIKDLSYEKYSSVNLLYLIMDTFLWK